jgi:hypothetical protein
VIKGNSMTIMDEYVRSVEEQLMAASDAKVAVIMAELGETEASKLAAVGSFQTIDSALAI